MSEQENIRVVKQSFENINKHVLDDDQISSPNARVRMVDSSTELNHDEYREYLRGILNAFPDTHFTIRDIIAQGEKVALTWTVRGTHKGSYVLRDGKSVPATNRVVQMPGCTIYEFRNNLVIHQEVLWDQVSFMTQLGLMAEQQTMTGSRR